MKILIAGATGAIGKPLIGFLQEQGHTLWGITQSQERAKGLEEQGAQGVILDVLDQSAVFSAVAKIKPDILIDMLTHLPKEYTPQAMQEAASLDAKIRIEGGANLLAAAEKEKVKRTIVQSAAFWYAPGNGLADETVPFAFEAPLGIALGSKRCQEIEQRALRSSLDAIALRFGFFYGPGTWFSPEGNIGDQVRRGQFPIEGSGTGIWNFIHIEDAAKAIVLALEAASGCYNIVNDTPISLAAWLPAFAKTLQAPPPPYLTAEEAVEQRGEETLYYATRLRGATNAKAKQIFSFSPRPFNYGL